MFGKWFGKVKNDPVVFAHKHDKQLLAASETARKELPYFIDTFNENEELKHINSKMNLPTDVFDFNVKVRFVDEGEDDGEYLWVSLVKINKRQFEGLIANEPGIVSSVKFGQKVKGSVADVYDWMILNTLTNQAEGGYTSQVLQKRQKK